MPIPSTSLVSTSNSGLGSTLSASSLPLTTPSSTFTLSGTASDILSASFTTQSSFTISIGIPSEGPPTSTVNVILVPPTPPTSPLGSTRSVGFGPPQVTEAPPLLSTQSGPSLRQPTQRATQVIMPKPSSQSSDGPSVFPPSPHMDPTDATGSNTAMPPLPSSSLPNSNPTSSLIPSNSNSARLHLRLDSTKCLLGLLLLITLGNTMVLLA